MIRLLPIGRACTVVAAAAVLLVFVSSGAASAGGQFRDRATDLRLTLVGSPHETRPGGYITYTVTVANAGGRRARNVQLALTGVPADLVSVASRGLSCSHGAQSDIRCSARSLGQHSQAVVKVTARAIRLGVISVVGTASSRTPEITRQNNAAAVRTSVLTPDSAQVAASGLFAGHPEFLHELTIDAISAPHGHDPVGTFSLNWPMPDGTTQHLAGRVLCLNVSASTAGVAVLLDDTNYPQPTIGGLKSDALFFELVDNGAPGAGRDTIAIALGWRETVQQRCRTAVSPASLDAFPIRDGDVSITDTP